MADTVVDASVAPVRKTITVKASQADAFRIFAEDFDSWWPRSHHIGSSPMVRAAIEGHVGGRCYSAQEDGTDCPWGTVLVWDPPRRLVFAWQISAEWQYQPNLDHASEVEVRFTALGPNETQVDLEHRGFEKMENGSGMRAGVDSPNGWGDLLKIYAARAES